MTDQLIEEMPLSILRPQDMASMSHRDLHSIENVYSYAQETYLKYHTQRGWTLENAAMGQCYDTDLPRCLYPGDGSRVGGFIKSSELVSALIEERKHITVADFGYGAGRALFEAVNREDWAGRVDYYAVGFSDLAKKYIIDEEKGISMYDLLLSKGIKFIEKSITDLRPGDLPKVDLIVSCAVLPYVTNYPQWECVKKMYNHFLTKGGYLLLSGFGKYWDQDRNGIVDDPLMRRGIGRYKWKEYLDKLGVLGHKFKLHDDLLCKAGLSAFKNTEVDLPSFVDGYKRPPDRLFNSSQQAQQRIWSEKPKRKLSLFKKMLWKVRSRL